MSASTNERPLTVADALYMCRQDCAYAEIGEVEPKASECLRIQQDLNPGTKERICGYAAQAMLGYNEDKESK